MLILSSSLLRDLLKHPQEMMLKQDDDDDLFAMFDRCKSVLIEAETENGVCFMWGSVSHV